MLRHMLHLGKLERRLFWIVLVGLIPLTLLSFVTLLKNAEAQRQNLIMAAEDTMSNVVSAVDSEIRAARASLDALATSPRLARGDFAGFQEEARALLERRDHWANVILSNSSAQQVMNAVLPQGSPLPARVDAVGIEEVVRTGDAAVGNVVFSPVLKTHLFAVRVPIKTRGEVKYVLNAALHPQIVQEILSRQHFAKGGVVVVLDRNKKVVARSLSPNEWIGQSPSATLLELLERSDENAWGRTTTLEGVSAYTIYYRSVETGWTAAIGVPTRTLDAPITRSYVVLGGFILGSIVLGFVVAFITGQTITRPMLELERAAVAVGEGRTPEPPKTTLPQVRQAALALAAAHTQREILLQKEREARLAAEEASRAKDEFLAMLGHELRNPLAAISSAAQLLDHADKVQAREAADHAKAIIRRQVHHLRRLTDDLLDAGRVIMGKIALDQHPVNLATLARGTLDTLRKADGFADQTVTVELEPVWISADATRIEQVIGNLVTNAAKYTPAGGSIVVQLREEQGAAVLSVRDSGIGIEADLLPKIFDLFVQGRRSLDRSQGGLGIGLTLVQRLTELHGGRVEARSEGPGLGSEFIVRLPAIAPHHRSETPRSRLEVLPRSVVVIEDNVDVRESLRKYLEFEGHRVVEANDGRAGVEIVLQERAEVAIVDIGLPELDGFAVARAIRSRATHEVRLIAMSGYGHQQDIERGLLAGFDAYLTKPVDHARLNEIIAQS